MIVTKEILEERLMCLHMGLARDVAQAMGIHVRNGDTRIQVVSNIAEELVAGYKNYAIIDNVTAGKLWKLSDNVITLPSDEGHTVYNHTRREQTNPINFNNSKEL